MSNLTPAQKNVLADMDNIRVWFLAKTEVKKADYWKKVLEDYRKTLSDFDKEFKVQLSKIKNFLHWVNIMLDPASIENLDSMLELRLPNLLNDLSQILTNKFYTAAIQNDDARRKLIELVKSLVDQIKCFTGEKLEQSPNITVTNIAITPPTIAASIGAAGMYARQSTPPTTKVSIALSASQEAASLDRPKTPSTVLAH